MNTARAHDAQTTSTINHKQNDSEYITSIMFFDRFICVINIGILRKLCWYTVHQNILSWEERLVRKHDPH